MAVHPGRVAISRNTVEERQNLTFLFHWFGEAQKSL